MVIEVPLLIQDYVSENMEYVHNNTLKHFMVGALAIIFYVFFIVDYR